MTDTNFILAASGRPFQDWDAANMKASMMAADLADDSFRVVEHPEGGYAVARGENLAAVEANETVPVAAAATEALSATPAYEIPEAPADALAREIDADRAGRRPPAQDGIGGVVPFIHTDDRHESERTEVPEAETTEPGSPSTSDAVVPTLTDYTGKFPQEFALNVAPRAFIQLHILTILGVLLLLFPHWLLAPLGGFGGFQDPTLGASVLGIIRMGAMILGVCALSKFLYTYLLYRYVVTNDSVEANFGFIARDAPKVFFAHIRTTKVVQSWWQRLLVVGDVALGTGATDQHEVVLKHISNPKRIEQELERRYLPFIRSQHRIID